MSKSKKRLPELYSGRYTPVPHEVLDSAAFLGASSCAKAMLFELLRQHNGRNNGHLQLAYSWLRKRGWNSTDQAQKAKAELLARQLVIKTRRGGLNMGADQYALTWLPVSDFTALDVRLNEYRMGGWRQWDPPAPLLKQKTQTAGRCCPVPPGGPGEAPAVPPAGAKTAFSDAPAVPPGGHNESCHSLG